jgi:EH domain-containing protein 1
MTTEDPADTAEVSRSSLHFEGLEASGPGQGHLCRRPARDAAAPAAAQAADSGQAIPQDSSEDATQKEVMRHLWKLYEEIVLPIEEESHFRHFHNQQPVTKLEFLSNPQVLLVGQYSTGKTSMVKWLTQSSSAHFDVRPQPSTDKFMAVVHGDEEKLVEGNAASCLPQLPYTGLASFGGSFLSSFQALVMPVDLLQGISFIDTPGVLAGTKNSRGRGYDFYAVCSWLAERADLVLLTFDAHRLDISDELVRLMEVLKPHSNKMRCVLNKVDQVTPLDLVKVYGALTWNLGKVLQTPEITKVFASSFWDQEYKYGEHRKLFDEDREAILKELYALPRTALMRKIDILVSRIRRVRAHFCIVAHIRSQLPYLQTEAGRHRWVSTSLPQLFNEAKRSRGISDGDMPSEETFRASLAKFEGLHRLPAWQAGHVERLNQVLQDEVPRLLARAGGVTPAAFASPLPASLLEPELGRWPCSKRRRIQ